MPPLRWHAVDAPLRAGLIQTVDRSGASVRILALTISLFFVSASAYGAGHESITLTSTHEPYVVPEGHVWKVERLDPYESETGVGTSDFSIDGSAQIGRNREFNLDGKFEFTFSAKQPFPL